MCVHRVGSGHYTAYGSHEGRWYHFNDSTVTLTNEDTVRKAKAYILFYVERTAEAPSDAVAADGEATGNPDVDAAPTHSVSFETTPQTESAADTAQTDMALMDGTDTHIDTWVEKPQEDSCQDMAALKEAPTDEASLDQTGTEDTLQVLQTVAP